MNQNVSFSQRLKSVLKAWKISRTELARRINVKPQVIQYLCTADSNKSKFVFDIAEALNIDVSWLMSGKGEVPKLDDTMLNKRVIPVLDFNAIKEYTLNKFVVDRNKVKNWLPISDDVSLNSFAIVMTDRAMAPQFDLDSIIIIDTTEEIQKDRRNFALVYLKEEDFIIFRELEITNEDKTLHPLNTKLYKPIQLSAKDKIIGFCKEVRLNY